MINVTYYSNINFNTASKPKQEEASKKTPENKQSTEVCSSKSSLGAFAYGSAMVHSSQKIEDPGTTATLEVPASEIETNETEYTQGIICTVFKEQTGDEVNAELQKLGFKEAPYKQGTKVQYISLNEETTFCRVYKEPDSWPDGNWIMKKSDIEGLTPEEIRDKYALPATPVSICDVTLPKGTVLRTGKCASVDGWGNGGGTQFDFMGRKDDYLDCFLNNRDL